MTETSYYPPAASARRQRGAGTSGPVLVSVAGPAGQRRVTVAGRLILAIPHVLALSVLGIAAFFVVAGGWLGALVTGRLPRFATTYLSGYLRWHARAGAYLLLLTDEYPPFTLGDTAYPVRLAVASGKLNRLTVLFRIAAAIPAAIVSMLLTLGLATIVIITGWLAALIAGRLPAPLHQAFAAVLRYTTRCHGYLYLLTGEYPAGIFGDDPASQPQAAPEAGVFGQDASWRFALSSGARRLVGLMLVLGLLTLAGGGAWAGLTINADRQRAREISQLRTDVAQFNAVVVRHNAAVAREQLAASQVTRAAEVLTNANDTLNGVLDQVTANPGDCSTVTCSDLADKPAADAFAAFGRILRATPLPPGSAAIGKRLMTDNDSDEHDWQEMSQAATFTVGINFATAAEKVGGQWDSDYAALTTSLGNEYSALGDEAVTLNNAATALTQQAAALNRRATALNVTVSLRTANPGSLPTGRR